MLKVNGEQIEVTRFPDGTSQVWKLPFEVPSKVSIDWDFALEGEIIQLAQLVELLKVQGAEYITLNMDFLPYGRQDKAITNESTFALQTFARIINSMGFDEVTSLDTHNPEAAEMLINNFRNIFPYYEVEKVVKTVNPDVICFPDKGAIRRYTKDLSFLNKIHIFGDKERDQQTGHIVKYTLQDDVTDRNVLIVDDICDGGMTFIHLAKALKENGAKSINLYTTHGIYSKGLRPLRDAKIERIFSKQGEMGELHGALTYKEIV